VVTKAVQTTRQETSFKKKRQGRNLKILDIIESVYQSYFYVNAIIKVFEYYSGQWKLNECNTLYNIP